jgi:uncharacterized protein (TIGR01777 family)
VKLLIAGATGFIGHELVAVLVKNHEVTVIGRDWLKLQQHFTKEVTIVTWSMLSKLQAPSYDLIINLCGHNISASRWNENIKQELISSRVDTSKTLIDWAIEHDAKPRFICANAVGIYGLQKESDPDFFDEDSPIEFSPPKDFLNEIGLQWQQALQPAIDFGMSVTTLRFGIVLKKDEGMLKKLALSFSLGLGSILGSGKQVLSWIHYADVTAAVQFLIEHPELSGAFNLTSPEPVTQEEFAMTLANVMHRPRFLKIPAWFIKKAFGEMGETLLLNGQRVLPKRLINAGYRFRYPELYEALKHEFDKNTL